MMKRSDGQSAERVFCAIRLFGVAALAAMSLTACSDRALDTGLINSFIGAESAADTSNTPLRRIGAGERDYPNLASVPARPTDLRSQSEQQADRDALKRDRDYARSQLPTVAPVPPAPNLRPGVPSY